MMNALLAVIPIAARLAPFAPDRHLLIFLASGAGDPAAGGMDARPTRRQPLAARSCSEDTPARA